MSSLFQTVSPNQKTGGYMNYVPYNASSFSISSISNLGTYNNAYSSVSPLSPVSYTPVSKLVVSPYDTKVITTMVPTYKANILTTTFLPVEIDPGLNDSYIAQKETTEYLLYRVLDKWLYTDEMCHLLKYFKLTNDKVEMIKSESEIKANKICSDSVEEIEKKADYIEEHFLGKEEMKKLLTRMIQELGLKWYELTQKESLVVDTVERYLNKKLKERVTK